MKKLLVVLVVFATVFLTSCSVDSSKVDGQKFQNDISYFQCQTTGEVYAIVGIEKATSFEQTGVGIAHINKSDVTPVIIKHISNYKDPKSFR